MAGNFQTLIRTKYPFIHEAQQDCNTKDIKETMPRHIITKLTRMVKKKFLKAAREKGYIALRNKVKNDNIFLVGNDVSQKTAVQHF